jgi:hypothetical protein
MLPGFCSIMELCTGGYLTDSDFAPGIRYNCWEEAVFPDADM